MKRDSQRDDDDAESPRRTDDATGTAAPHRTTREPTTAAQPTPTTSTPDAGGATRRPRPLRGPRLRGGCPARRGGSASLRSAIADRRLPRPPKTRGGEDGRSPPSSVCQAGGGRWVRFAGSCPRGGGLVAAVCNAEPRCSDPASVARGVRAWRAPHRVPARRSPLPPSRSTPPPPECVGLPPSGLRSASPPTRKASNIGGLAPLRPAGSASAAGDGRSRKPLSRGPGSPKAAIPGRRPAAPLTGPDPAKSSSAAEVLFGRGRLRPGRGKRAPAARRGAAQSSVPPPPGRTGRDAVRGRGRTQGRTPPPPLRGGAAAPRRRRNGPSGADLPSPPKASPPQSGPGRCPPEVVFGRSRTCRPCTESRWRRSRVVPS